MVLRLDDGRRALFVNDGSGEWARPAEVFADLAWEASPGRYRLDWADGDVWQFDTADRIEVMQDWRGQGTSID